MRGRFISITVETMINVIVIAGTPDGVTPLVVTILVFFYLEGCFQIHDLTFLCPWGHARTAHLGVG